MPKDWSGDANSIFKQLGATSHSERERERAAAQRGKLLYR